ncbi:MAG: lysine 5,6-aminomutase reactivase subunit KamB [Ktedonobacteraceae bacterium]
MLTSLAQIVANENVHSLSLIGLSKNVGKTTTTNHLLETLVGEKHYRADELALTSLGLDGEATDALTGLPKPRYVAQAGFLVATTTELLLQAERDGTQVERLLQMQGGTALGSVVLARILRPGRVIIAGPTLLRDLGVAIDQLGRLGALLSIVDGAINRLGAAAPTITDACIVCTGASAAATPELVGRRTVDLYRRLSTQQTRSMDAYRKHISLSRLSMFTVDDDENTNIYIEDSFEPLQEAGWIVKLIQTRYKPIFILRGALTEELSRALLVKLPKKLSSDQGGELVVEDATRIFCHSLVLQRLSERGLEVRVANPIRVLALTVNPYTPEYFCSSRHLLDVLAKELSTNFPPIIDVISGFANFSHSVT